MSRLPSDRAAVLADKIIALLQADGEKDAHVTDTALASVAALNLSTSPNPHKQRLAHNDRVEAALSEFLRGVR